MVSEKIEIGSSEKDSNTIDGTHWEDEYYSYLSNSGNEGGQSEYSEKYHNAGNQLKEIREEMELKESSPPPSLIAEVSNPPVSLYPEVVPMQLDGQTDISVEEVAINISPEQTPACLYPTIVIKTQSDGQAQGKDTLTEPSPDEGKIRDRKPKIKSLPQKDGPTDPSNDDESTEEGNSPRTEVKTKNQAERRKLTKSPKITHPCPKTKQPQQQEREMKITKRRSYLRQRNLLR
ncbi:hypothetical protein JTB14_017042 [Gonioctena quinquepunctata]|nr:hypothetical protein JTB14_017042 [Gonioctena quinquepunctata]